MPPINTIDPRPVILSYGLGVDSTAILLRWLTDHTSRDFELSQLIVVTAMTGDEYDDTGELVTDFILPVLRLNRVRYVQVARASHSERDGIRILDDSREPQRLYLEGAYKLSDELFASGVIPQSGGAHLCSQKFKAWVIDTWLEDELKGASYRIVFGFNQDEPARIARSEQYRSQTRHAEYPLLDWGWGREEGTQFCRGMTGREWQKSACVFCPFLRITPPAILRFARHGYWTKQALLLEHMALCFNPRSMLYKRKSMREVVAEHLPPLWYAFNHELFGRTFALYRVRRAYSRPATADRCIERLETGTYGEMANRFAEVTEGLSLSDVHGITYAHRHARIMDSTVYPQFEEYYVLAPALAPTKARYGVEKFNAKWKALREAA